MYKKIKNGSFMNWIWFIVALMPLLLLFIYSSTFIFNKQTNGYEIKNLINWQDDFVGDNNSTYNYQNNEFYYNFYVGDEQVTFNYNNNILLINNYRDDFFDTNIEITTQDNVDNFYYLYLKIESQYNLQNTIDYFDINNELKQIQFNNNEFIKIYSYFDSTRDNISIEIQNYLGYDGIIPLKIYLFICNEDIQTNLLNEQQQLYNIIVDSTYNSYLVSILNTIQTNGFISNAFLNLAQFFGVNNVYYSLACYYIEYLLVIVLLHLAFDVLYMLPNICHKFMEKIGGERD